jgi:hypothetical protein
MASERGADRLFDARGCLTDEAFAQIAGAPAGQVPADLAGHLSSCARCQQRLLVKATPGLVGVRAPRRPPPKPWRTAAVIVGLLLLIVMALMTLRYFTTQGP